MEMINTSVENELRIERYYNALISSLEGKNKKGEFNDKYSENFNNVLEVLLPYAEKNNFWWEKRDAKMAYYQLQTPILVVSMRDFEKCYYKLMGKKLDLAALQTYETRKEILKQAKENYKRLTDNKKIR